MSQQELELRLVKSANKFGLLTRLGSSIKDLVYRGMWGRVYDRTAQATGGFGKGLNRVSKAFYNPETRSATGLSQALSYYGLASMFNPNLPGAGASMYLSAPGAALMFKAPNVITTGRLALGNHQDAIKSDVLSGADQAKMDFISSVQMDPNSVRGAAGYEKFRKDNGYDFGLADRYRNSTYKPMSWLSTIGGAFNDPQRIVNDRVDQGILQYSGMGKQANWSKLWPAVKAGWGGVQNSWLGGKVISGAGATARGVGKALPWVTPTLATGLTAHALLRDKPYEEAEVADRGYAAAQNEIRNKLGNLNFMERMALKVDPTLAIQKLEESMPGSIRQWENQNGALYRPGFLSRLYQGWNTGGSGKYYTYDVTGNRRYIG